MTEVFYIADPMCSWCWGFAPVIAKVGAELKPDIGLRLVLGGLAPDSELPMEESMLRYVKSAWRAVAERTGAEFNHDFWERHHPRRSTWPACRAVLAAGDRALEMFSAIQRAYYTDARDPSDKQTLADLGAELGFDRDLFLKAIDAPATHAQLAKEFELRDQLGAMSYPSVGVERSGELQLIASGWNTESALRSIFKREGLIEG